MFLSLSLPLSQNSLKREKDFLYFLFRMHSSPHAVFPVNLRLVTREKADIPRETEYRERALGAGHDLGSGPSSPTN